nr:MAG TPA: hypothetical protein [Caudoviricetes sp.]
MGVPLFVSDTISPQNKIGAVTLPDLFKQTISQLELSCYTCQY